MQELTPHQKKALNYNAHISLTANAGSGKTFVLSKRYVEIAVNEDISLRNIAAITFTDKAAGDLYKKIAKEIDERIEAETEVWKKQKLEHVRRQLVSANISTIHSFCIDIIREYPIESNVDANFTPIDESYSSELIEFAVEEVLKEQISSKEKSDLVKSLIRIFGSKDKLAEELIELIRNKKNVSSINEKIYSQSEKEIADFFFSSYKEISEKTILASKHSVIKAIENINFAALSDSPKGESALLIDKLLNNMSAENETETLALIAQEILTKSGKRSVRKRGYIKKAEDYDIADDILTVEKYLPEIEKAAVPENHEEIEIELARFGCNMLTVYQAVLEKYDRKKSDLGCLDFEDILLTTKEILKNDDVREKLSEKYKYLMIDEYQDTNEIQYDIFLPILEYLKKNNLFVVGDEKQSIYMFRDAELAIFRKTKADIQQVNGEEYLLNLPDSFRMAPEICQFTNFVFAKLFKDVNVLYNEVKPNDLVCGRADGVSGKIELLINKDEEDDNGVAELIALRINELIHNDNFGKEFSFGNISVLCRKRKAFAELEKAFADNEIPYAIVGGKGFYQKQFVSDFFNYFSFIQNPENDAALAGILRSPFFSVDDSTLYKISLEEGTTYWQKLEQHSAKNEAINKIAGQIRKNLILKNSLDVASLFRIILSETSYIPVISSQKNNLIEIENLNKLINLSISFFSEGFRTLYDYVDFLKNAIATSEDEGQADVTADDDTVKIMTIHQSKGLEFEAVFLYKCNEQSQKSLVKSKTIIADKNFGLLTKVPLNDNYFDDYQEAPIVTLANYIIAKKEMAEQKRLFYVAVTRAKTRLFITADYKNGKFPEGSMMGMLTDTLQINYDEENCEINSELNFLKKNDDGYYNENKKLTLVIPIIDTIEFRKPEIIEVNVERPVITNVTEKIIDIPEGEIFSATKIAAYKRCPLKYKLAYNYDFDGIYKDYSKWSLKNPGKDMSDAKSSDVEYSKLPEISDEETGIKMPEMKGRIIHAALQNDIKGDRLREYATEQLSNRVFIELQNKKEIEIFINEIIKSVNSFFNSAIYKEISGKKEYFNEFEIYVKENNYILYGIIDKLIIEDGTITIIDFKTDNIVPEKLSERYNSYLPQLKFYSYIVNKYFKNFNRIITRVIFIKYPEYDFSETVNKEDLSRLGSEYAGIINKIRNQEFPKNLKHCPECIYSTIGNKCVVI
jgi:ATP-dependent helicase/nuclease subunit A